MDQTIIDYNNQQTQPNQAICQELAHAIDRHLAQSESKIWHGSPVWFLDGNPIVGYSVLKDAVQLLFWSGQSFDEIKLQSEGKFKAAEIRYRDEKEINIADLKRWLNKAEAIQWDYKNIVKRKGELVRLNK